MEARKKGSKEAPKETKQKGRKAKGPTRRSKTSFRGLEKRFYSRIKQEYFDLDYVNKLSDEEKEWMNKFMNEFLGANIKESENKPLHKTKRAKKKVFDANNDRNRDIYGMAKAMGKVIDTLAQPNEQSGYDIEDAYIDIIDGKKARKH